MIDRFLSLNKKMKLSVILFGVGLIGLCLILVSQSYAIFSGTTTDSNDQIVKLGSLEVILNEPSTGIDLGLSPMSDVDGLLQNDVYSFTVENTGSANAMYKVKIIDDDASKASYTGTLLDKGLVKIGLTVNGKEKGPFTLSELNELLNEKELKSGRKDHYKLRLWISEDANLDEITDQQIFLKLKLEAEQYFTEIASTLDNSGANAPELASNMIPVYYDDTDNVWRKADSNNKDKKYQWYDYDKKMWANAVTVNDTVKNETVSDNKGVNLSNGSVLFKTYSSFTSGGHNINNAKSYTQITVNINTAGTFGFKATVSSEASYDKLTVTVSKNGGTVTTVANGISGSNSNTYSDTAAVGDVYVITAQYTKDGSSHSNNDNGVLDTFTYPSNSSVTYTDSVTAGGTSGQDWTAVEGTSSTKSGVIVGNSILYDDTSKQYNLIDTSFSAISNNIVGKYICSNVVDSSCEKVYKIVEASNNITKVNEYATSVVSRSEFLKASVGTRVSMDDINTMWVWIPRYTYTYLNTNTPQEINVEFESYNDSNGTIVCNDSVLGSGTTSQTCTDSVNGGLVSETSTYTHPAFTFGDKELSGIWVGKFENSAKTILTSSSTAESEIIIKPDVQSLRYKAISYHFRDIRQMEKASNIYGFEQSSSTTFAYTGELTGDTNSIDTHMMKNTEWGAVTYLSHSKYGVNKEININNSSGYYTGRSGGGVSGSTAIKNVYTNQTSTTQYNTYGFYTYDGYLLDYNTNTKSTKKDMSKIASTTGNIYGVYDMSGGSYEYMMGNMVNSSNQFYVSSAASWSTTLYPLSKYYDGYTYNSSNTTYTRGRLGDATVEMAPTGTTGNWYKDYAALPYSSYTWIMRGGYYSSSTNDGIFFFNYANGAYSANTSSRSVLNILE